MQISTIAVPQPAVENFSNVDRLGSVMTHAQAFLSYTRIEDEYFDGNITALRKLLELGVRVVTGDQTFEIFQDVDGIQLGQQWEKRITDTISSAKFLIPILTPPPSPVKAG